MINYILIFLSTLTLLNAIEIIQKPIHFSEHRKALTLEYIQEHYGLRPQNIHIIPQIIVVHYTAIATLEASFSAFNAEVLPQTRTDIAKKKESANVSVAYLVDKDGTIYQLMPDNWMGRHVIGLNYSSIGIENVGKRGGLTEQQLLANKELIGYLQQKYSSINYLVGHSDYRCFEETSLWLERDANYRTEKEDPGHAFMAELNAAFLNLHKAPCK